MPSTTTWRRLEPRTRTEALTSLAARVADPLWFLARQWQCGELTGCDTGSPVSVRLLSESTPVTRLQADGEPATTVAAGQIIDPVVDVIAPHVALADRVRAGRLFLRWLGPELAHHYGDGFRRAFSLPGLAAGQPGVDDASLRWSRLLSSRGIDGQQLRSALGPAGAPTLPSDPVIDANDADDVRATAQVFAQWWDDRYPPRTGAWRARQLAAPFRLGLSTSDGARELHAPEHRGGRVDWHSFDVGDSSLAGDDPPSAPPDDPLTSLPTRVGIAGLPSSRWWEFEEAAVDLGRLDAAPDDLARLLFAEFALVYGADFFVVPLAVPVGSLTRIASLQVETNFGETVEIPSTTDYDGPAPLRRRWRLFDIDDRSNVAAVPSGLFVPPAAVAVMDGEACEDVLLTRDEMANVAWAIERRVVGPWGIAVDRREVEYAQQRQSDDQPVVADELHYRLATSVPTSWLPLVPVAGGLLQLNTQQGGGPQSRLLTDGPAEFYVDSIELPRTGRQITLQPRRARRADGTTVLWWAHRARPGRGESSSGLRFDELTHERPT